MAEKEVSSHIIKLTGKAELPQAIDIGHNWHVALDGSVRSITEADNDDGTVTRIYTFKPIKVETLNELGETIRAKDTRSNSILIRSLLYKKWVNAASEYSFEEFYDKVCGSIMMNIDRIIDTAGL